MAVPEEGAEGARCGGCQAGPRPCAAVRVKRCLQSSSLLVEPPRCACHGASRFAGNGEWKGWRWMLLIISLARSDDSVSVYKYTVILEN